MYNKLKKLIKECIRIAKKAVAKVMKSNKHTRKLYYFVANKHRARKYRKYCREFPINNRMILFESNLGKDFAGAPRALYEYLSRDPMFCDYVFVWAMVDAKTKKHMHAMRNAQVVEYHSLKYYDFCSRAKYIVTNDTIDTFVTKRKEQIFVQTGPGVPMQTPAYDPADVQRYDYLLSPAAFATAIFKESLHLEDRHTNVKILEEGLPQNDFLTTYGPEDVYYAKKALDISHIDKKIILYIPTQRAALAGDKPNHQRNLPLSLDRLQEELGDEYIVLLYAHNFYIDAQLMPKYAGFLYDASKHDDVNDLYLVADVLLTDYTNNGLDFALLKRPIVYLRNEKENAPALTVNPPLLPGTIAPSEKELLRLLKNLPSCDEAYDRCIETFHSLEDGQVTARIVEEIFQYELEGAVSDPSQGGRQQKGHKLKEAIKSMLRLMMKICFRTVYRFIPVDDKTAIFISFHGRGYSDNPKAIYEEMLKDPRCKDFKFYWFINGARKNHLTVKGAQVKDYNSLSYFFYMSRAKYWVINCKMPEYINKKKKQVYLQTWHGTPLKHLAHDIEVPDGTTFYRSEMSYEAMLKTYDVDVARYNYMISPNKFCTEVFQSAFAIDRERLIETGYPRNDIITNATKKDVERLKKKYRIPLDKKIILYAPTWRDNSYVEQGYTFELEADFEKWKEVFGPDYVVIFKPHYLIINKYKDGYSLGGFLNSIDAKADINELYVMSDVLITDYSSVFFDYAVLNRPIYFYMYDLDAYRDELRGFYLDIYRDLPGKIYESEDEMLSDIKQEVYDKQRLAEFNERFNHAQTGDCAKKAVQILLEGK